MLTRALPFLLMTLAACARGSDSGTPVSYLVTPDGIVNRIRSVGPVVNVEGKKLGIQVAFIGDSPSIERIVLDAERIARALGPELQLAGETVMMIRADVGFDPRKTLSRHPSFTVVFSRDGGSWVRHESKDGDDTPLSVEGPLMSPDDPSFPFDLEKTTAAAHAGTRWIATLDSGDSEAAVAAMTDSYRAETQGAIEVWRDKLAHRNALGVVGHRKELYRLLTRARDPRSAPDGVIVVQYEVTPAIGGKFLERVTLVRERRHWRPAGYMFWQVEST